VRASVLQAFPSFSTGFESRLPFMYLDVKNLVTTGIGNLIDPVAEALVLPWKRDGSLVSRDEIQNAWNTVKSRTDLAPRGGGAFAGVTTLRLDQGAIDNLVAEKAHANDAMIRSQFPAYDTWPADAQLAIHSDAWAQGASFRGWPHLVAALNASPPDFMAAAGPPGLGSAAEAGANPALRGQAWLNDAGNPGLRPRNIANKILWQNAARSLAGGFDPETLLYPAEIPAGATGSGRWRVAGELALLLLVLGGVGWGVWHFTPGKARWKGQVLRDVRIAEKAMGA
jgi:hypothetical protein